MIAAGRNEPEDAGPERTGSTPRSIVELGLRGPTLGVLQRQGIISIEQLVRFSPDELMSMRRVGLSRMLEIRQALQSHGMDLLVEAETPAVRAWGYSRRVRLTCCEYGDCVLDLRTAAVSADELGRVTADFVAAHRACARLGGREPVVTSSDTTRPIAFNPERASAPDDATPLQADDERGRARSA